MTAYTHDPGVGDPDSIHWMAVARQKDAERVRRSHAAVTAATDLVTGAVWLGKAQVAFLAGIESTLPDLQVLAEGLDAEAAALIRYGAEVRAIKDEQRTLAVQRTATVHEIEYLTARLRSVEGELYGNETDLELVRTRQGLLYSIDGQHAHQGAIQRQWDHLVERRRAADRACIAALHGRGVLGGTARFANGGSAGKTPDELLRMMAGMSAGDLAALLAADPSLKRVIEQADPQAISAWWESLGNPAQESLITAMPGVIGNLNGVAYWARDKANRINLDARVAAARAKLAGIPDQVPLEVAQAGRAAMVDWAHQHDAAKMAAQEELDKLLSVQKALKPAGSGPGRYLIEFTNDVPPLAAVAVGNVDTASNITFTVPGMSADAGGMKDWADSAQYLWTAQQRYGSIEDRAVVAWIGYKTPPVPSPGNLDFGVLELDRAQAGAGKLVQSLSGLNAARNGEAIAVNVVAHSYGTTTTSIALTQPGVHINAFVSLGSAGLPTTITNVSALNADHVYAGQAQDVLAIDPTPGDQWAWSGRTSDKHPVNPVNPSFGAVTFGCDGSGDLKGVTDHATHVPGTNTGYLDSQTESLRNVALATTGQSDYLTPRIEKPTAFDKLGSLADMNAIPVK